MAETKAQKDAKAKAEKAKAEKAEKAAKAKAEKEAAVKAREEAKAAREQEKADARQAQIDSGALITGPNGVEFHRIDEKKKDTLDTRAKQVLEVLERSKTPVLGKELQERFGGVWPLYIPMFSMLKAQGLIVEYRRRTGERGGSGVAYLHTNHVS